MHILETERLKLRTWTLDDLEIAARLWGRDDVMKYIDVRGGLTREQLKQKLETEISYQEKYGVQYWPIFEKQTGEFIGASGLKPWVHSARGGLEMGFHFVPTAWGKGYAKEVTEGVIAYAKRQGVPLLMAGHHPGNENAKKILEKLGFKFIEKVHFAPTGLMHSSYEMKLA